jgi:hypothetical protein
VERRAPSRDWSRASMHGHRRKPAMQRPSDLRIEIESLRRLSRTELRARWAPSSVIPTGGDPPPRGERSSGNDSKSRLHPDKGVTVRLRRPSAALATATARCCWSAEHPAGTGISLVSKASTLRKSAAVDVPVWNGMRTRLSSTLKYMFSRFVYRLLSRVPKSSSQTTTLSCLAKLELRRST